MPPKILERCLFLAIVKDMIDGCCDGWMNECYRLSLIGRRPVLLRRSVYQHIILFFYRTNVFREYAEHVTKVGHQKIKLETAQRLKRETGCETISKRDKVI